MIIQEIDASEIKPAKYNPRKDLNPKDKEYRSIKKSIDEFGFVEPLVWNKHNGNLIGGHQRFKILTKEFKKDKLLCSVVDIKDDKKEKALNLALNRVQGKWDMGALKEMLVDLDDGSFDLSLTGFTEGELKDFIDYDGIHGHTMPDDVPSSAKSMSAHGDLFSLGDHRLLCGDSSSQKDVQLLMSGNKADCVFTDPPYGVDLQNKNKFLNKYKPNARRKNGIKNDDIPIGNLMKMLEKSFLLMKSIMKDSCTVFMTAPQGGEFGLEFLLLMKKIGLPIRHILIWVKNHASFSLGRLDYDYRHEPIFMTWGKKHNFYGEIAGKTSVWEVDRPLKSDKHPTMKPVELYEIGYQNHTVEGDIVYDPFAGSGTCFIAAEKLGRRCFGMEIDPEYSDVIIKRWEDFAGAKAVKIEK